MHYNIRIMMICYLHLKKNTHTEQYLKYSFGGETGREIGFFFFFLLLPFFFSSYFRLQNINTYKHLKKKSPPTTPQLHPHSSPKSFNILSIYNIKYSL